MYRFSLTLAAFAAALVACGQDNSPTAAITDAVVVSRNPDIRDATPQNPTGVRGSTDVIVGSVVVRVPEGTALRAVGVSTSDTRLNLGTVFQNLRAVDGRTGIQIGATIGTLTPTVTTTDSTGYGLTGTLDVGEGIFGFLPTPWYGLGPSPATPHRIDFRADVRADASDEVLNLVNSLPGGVVVPIISVYLPSGEAEIAWVTEPMQRLFIVAH